MIFARPSFGEAQVLALTDFYNAPLPDLANKDDVPKVDKAFVPELAACIDQL
jgi:hypothetical protein